jgi:hypothetical protein
MGQGDEPGGGVPLVAARLHQPLRVDGRLDEPAWAGAPVFRGFVQSFPVEGAPPTEGTEVRVLYDDHTLYVGVKCLDSRPDDIVSPLGRRDRPASSDSVQVIIDSNHDHRTAVLFVLTAGGVQADGLVYDDDRVTFDWDAVWEGAVALLPDGWSAEFAIPLAVLRYSDAPAQRWGFGVQREVGRTHEKSATVLFPRSGRGIASRLGHLDGIEGIVPSSDLELVPYLAARFVQRPRNLQQPAGSGWAVEPIGDAGVDFQAKLGPSLRLTGAVNPDFGQVEADQIILNLSRFEVFFPEKRPFFNQGLDIFRPVGDGQEAQVPQQMFYSRRIGLDTPILGAAKLVGRAGDRVQLGILDTLVAGTSRPPGAEPGDVDSTLRWSWLQPLRLAPGSAYPFHRPLEASPLVAPVTRNYLAAVARFNAGERLTLGSQITSALPLASRCTVDAEAPPADPKNVLTSPWQVRGAQCDAVGGNAAALDFNATTADGEWYAYGQGALSQSAGGPPVRTLPDGIHLDRGDLGTGAFLRAGRRGGEPWRLELYWSWASPRLDLNAVGFQRAQNLQEAKAIVRYTRPTGWGPFHDYTFAALAKGSWTTDGSGLDRGHGFQAAADGLLKDSYVNLAFRVAYDNARFDTREITRVTVGGATVGARKALERPSWWTFSGALTTDPGAAAGIDVEYWVGKNRPAPPLDAPWFLGAIATLRLRPHPRAETQLGLSLDYSVFANRYVGDLESDPDHWVFGQLVAPQLSLTLRQLLVLTPRLTFQLYGQLFTDYGKYTRFFVADRNLAVVRLSDLTPSGPPRAGGGNVAVDFRDAQLLVNAVLRWEYRPGSTLYLVYGRNQAQDDTLELPSSSEHRLAVHALGPANDTLMVKWSCWFGP